MKIDLETVKAYGGRGDLVMWGWLAEGSRQGPDPIVVHRKRDLEVARLVGWTVDSEPGGLVLDPVYKQEIEDGGRLPRVEYIRRHLNLSTPWSARRSARRPRTSSGPTRGSAR
jgi:hypothetical protein